MVTSDDSSWPPAVFVLIPAYQAAETLRPFLPEILETVPAGNVCIVDDGSSDGTEALCSSMGVRCLRHPQNRGKGAALAAGFQHLLHKGAEAIITLDADGQHTPEHLPDFLEAFKNNPDAGIIIGSRKIQRGHMPVLRVFSNTITSRILTWMTGTPILDSQCGYRLYSGKFLRSVIIEYPRFEMESEVIIKAADLGLSVLFIPVQTLYLNGKSHISHAADTLRWIIAVIKIRRTLTKRKSTGKTSV